MPMRKMLVIALSSPFLVGIYEDDVLVYSFEKEGKASDELPQMLCGMFDEHLPQEIYFADGPGSLMAIKIAFVALRTLSISSGAKLFSADGFNFNGSKPIRAGKGFGFIKKDLVISSAKLSDDEFGSFYLPAVLNNSIFEPSSVPRYEIPAV